MQSRVLPWHSPLDIAYNVSLEYDIFTLLYSGQQRDYSGRYSLLAFDEKTRLDDVTFSELKSIENDYVFGYFSYEAIGWLEKVPHSKADILPFPISRFSLYHHVMLFDHTRKTVTHFYDTDDDLHHLFTPNTHHEQYISTHALSSNMSKLDYLNKVQTIKETIEQGVLSQANLTRKFYGTLSAPTNHYQLFTQLCAISPSPYSAFFTWGEKSIISSSPEQFITIDENNHAITRPIKGTAPRFSDTQQDLASKKRLCQSIKDRAENLMITDLMRNDFSRTCIPGSVRVPSLYDVTSHASVHHMSSTITGQLRPDKHPLDMLEASFPPGSMTGTPKLKAIELCSALEQQQRGVYSGTIVAIKPNGSLDSSVIIRTLLIDGSSFTFQVGGAIVHDSNPHAEWQETMDKAHDLCTLLNIPRKDIEAL